MLRKKQLGNSIFPFSANIKSLFFAYFFKKFMGNLQKDPYSVTSLSFCILSCTMFQMLYNPQGIGNCFMCFFAFNIYLNNMFFDANRYDLAHVGIYKLNKKLALSRRLLSHRLAQTVVDKNGEIIAMEGDVVSLEVAEKIQNAGVNSVDIVPLRREGHSIIEQEKSFRVLGNNTVDALEYLVNRMPELDFSELDLAELGIIEKVYVPVIDELIAEAEESDEPLETLKAGLKASKAELCPYHLTIDDIVASICS